MAEDAAGAAAVPEMDYSKDTFGKEADVVIKIENATKDMQLSEAVFAPEEGSTTATAFVTPELGPNQGGGEVLFGCEGCGGLSGSLGCIDMIRCPCSSQIDFSTL